MNRYVSPSLILCVEEERWPLKTPFHIAGHTWVELSVVLVTLEQCGSVGRGEAAGVYNLNDHAPSIKAQAETVREAI